jgi:hypothetical protein
MQEIRNPKHEIRKKFEWSKIQMTGTSRPVRLPMVLDNGAAVLGSFPISIFGFRA